MDLKEEQITVIVADDDQRFRENACKLLEARGFVVLAAAGGEECLRLLGEVECDVVVLDQKMPGMNGIETLKAIKKCDRPPEVIMLTGHASVDDAVEGVYLGANEYLLKPTTTEHLADKILGACERRRERFRRGAAGNA